MSVIYWDFDGTITYSNPLCSGTVYDSLKQVAPDTTVEFTEIRKYMAKGFTWHTPDNDYTTFTNDKWWDFMADEIAKVVKISWESQRPENPETLEGKLLHDAHILEGGKTYTIVKTLITGSVRGQTLNETLSFMKDNVLDKNICYLPKAQKLCKEMNDYTNEFYNDLVKGIE